MLKLCILYLFVLRLSAQETKTGDPAQTGTTVDTSEEKSSADSSDEDKRKADNLTIANFSRENSILNKSVNATGNILAPNGIVEGVDTGRITNATNIEGIIEKLNKGQIVDENGKVKTNQIANTTASEDFLGKVTQTESEPITNDALNETFIGRIEQVVKRLFKREVVGSLVDRDSTELRENPKITVPMFFQPEYYQLRLRKQEIERNKNIFRKAANRSLHEDLIQTTWEKLVNWSQDHLAFEDKVIKIHQLKTHAHIQNTKEVDSDATEDSEDELRSIDSDEDSDKSMRPEFATVRNLAEVNDRYPLEKKIEELERIIKNNPKEENNEKNRLLLNRYRHDLKMVDMKYERIREMKINRKFIEEVWKEKNMIDRKKKGEDTDDDL